MKLGPRYFVAFAALATAACVTLGIADAARHYQENVNAVGQVQRAEARVVATQIAAYLNTLVSQLDDVARLPWQTGLFNSEERRREMRRLLKLNSAIDELHFVTTSGREREFVSRIQPDRSDAQVPWSLADIYPRDAPPSPWYGPVYFKEGSIPFVSVAVRPAELSGDLLVAEINMRYVTDLIAGLKIGHAGRAFLIDSTDHLIAHPSLSFVHRKVNLAGIPQVISARAKENTDLIDEGLTESARSPDAGAEVLTSVARVAAPRWLVFVEQPREEVMAPVRASIYQTGAMLLLFLAASIVVSRWLAMRLTRPIVDLEQGAARIGAGDHSVRVSAGTEDEILSLGAEFNRMAENLGRSYAELETKVKLRTRDLDDAHRDLASLNEELRLRLDELGQRKEEAERSNVAKTRFLAAASHDLRQPLQAISLLVEVLRERIERITDRDVAVLVHKVQVSVQALESLFVSLLDISRLDAGAVRPHTKVFCVETLLRLIEANFLPQALERGLKLRVVPSTAVVRTDPALLERILGNLVSNAIRYTPHGRIVVGCRRHGDHLRVLVIDTGIGVPESLREEIFEEFFQVANLERDRSMGLGLGLSIVKRTAQILGHTLIVRSTINRGSTFGVELPLIARPIPLAPGTRVATVDSGRFAGVFVLVIDDEEENRFAIEALCRQWGCSVVGAGSAAQALQTLEDHLRSPDLIICDFRLRGGETAITAIALMRQRIEENIPSIVVTGDMSVRDIQGSISPPVALLHKPINAERLWIAAADLLPEAAVQRI